MAQSLADWAKKPNRSKTDERLVVDGLHAGGDPSVLGRLGDLGVQAGETIYFSGRAPLGEPIYINVRETVIALRLGEAELIFVRDPNGGV